MISEDKKKTLKDMIRQLHAGVPPLEVKEKYRHILEDISSEEIAKIENELVKEGMPREEIQRLCDVHLAVFREQLEKQKVEIPTSHPIGILMEEHKIMLQLAERLNASVKKAQQVSDRSYVGDEIHHLEHIARDFTDSEKHYVREENVIFPLLEKHGVTEPPAIMWMEHNQIRERKKAFNSLIGNYDTLNFRDFKKQLAELAEALGDMLPNHFFKENNILFPTAMRVSAEEEWANARKEFDEIGYCCFTPPHLTATTQQVEESATQGVAAAATSEGLMQFETGTLSKDEMEAILNTLPVDISFVDANDAVKYFNKADKRIFVRTRAVIGRKAQLCHPQKSVHVVNKILQAFRKGEKDAVEFWINVKGRLVHINYFAVRDGNGKYLGTMEVTQDITDIKKIEGEKRLLDWEE